MGSERLTLLTPASQSTMRNQIFVGNALLSGLPNPWTLMDDLEVVPEPLEASSIQVNDIQLCPRYKSL